MKKLCLFFNTIRFLKIKQIYYRIYYMLRQKWRSYLRVEYSVNKICTRYHLNFLDVFTEYIQYKKKTFVFLNKDYSFDKSIDWNFSKHGKLWTYNLTYFDYLNQKNVTKDDGINLIKSFVMNSYKIEDGLEAFPISIRGINWIKFLSKHNIEDENISNSLYLQYMILVDNIEYHLLGNHLLENAYSILFASYYFQNEKMYNIAADILKKELDEQILEDGAHFELSPMYHQIMLFRILDCINLLQHNQWKSNNLLEIFEKKASMMLGWIYVMTYEDGSIPLLNDCANNIAPTTKELFIYANKLGIEMTLLSLGECGYRKVKKDIYECILDIGNIGPDYIPGHAHSDTFSFELYIHGIPFIVDTGTSTYETNKERANERSTKAHNTVMLNGVEQSKVWSSFRVAERAKVSQVIEDNNYVSAVHDGYEKEFQVRHQREFKFDENSIKIIDTLHSISDNYASAYLHFAPNISVIIDENRIICNDISILSSVGNIRVFDYEYAPEFNKTIKAKVVEIIFVNKLEMEIQL